ncbi:MAG: farnesyltranstransferase [Rickettsiaceae bacterium]|jgi:octaprenyl-diphosphate synthase|nr:farnesyltranstransferase [Rickettsiaceae bacterium]
MVLKLDVISKINAEIKSDIVALNNLILKSIKSDTELIEAVSNHLINAGGKRIRPILTILCAKLCEYKGTIHINLAASVEFIHTATLLHDDVVDESTVRRSLPTANVIWGSKASILVGDFLFSQAFIQMVTGNSIKALESLSRAASFITEGEVMQLSSIHKIEMGEEEYFDVIKRKTAELFATSCEIGAIISNQPDEISNLLKEYGKNLGLIFQLTDDLLDYFSTKEELGKNPGADFREGKVTLPVIHAYQTGTEEEKSFWERTMVDLQQNSDDFDKAKEIMKRLNVEAETFAKIEALKKHTLAIIAKLPFNNIYLGFLKDLIDFITLRKK